MTACTSLAAYLAHWRALTREHQKDATASPSPLLSEMNRTVAEILGDEARYVREEPADSAARRHRDRAESKLRRELIARRTITG
jgi:hypothetical protein